MKLKPAVIVSETQLQLRSKQIVFNTVFSVVIIDNAVKSSDPNLMDRYFVQRKLTMMAGPGPSHLLTVSIATYKNDPIVHPTMYADKIRAALRR